MTYNVFSGTLNLTQPTLVAVSVCCCYAESKRIEQSGGYVFCNMSVPTSFNFGARAM